MPPHLDAAAVRASAEATRVLVSPLYYSSAVEWRAAVHDALRSLFSADQTMSIVAGSDELVLSEDIDQAVLRSLRVWFDEFTPEGRVTMSDPVVNEWNDRRRASGIAVYTRDLIDHVIDHRVRDSQYVNEALVPNGIRFWQGLYAKGAANSDAILWVSYARTEREPFGEAAVPLLSLLVPAFQAGLDVLDRLEVARAALDALAHPLVVFDPAGHELHRTTALVELTARDPSPAILARARGLAKELSTALDLAGSDGPPRPAAHVSSDRGDYILRVTRLPEGLFFSVPTVAVLVQPRAQAAFPGPEALRITHGLTEREAQVALLLARGATRDRIAQALGISPHTARSHTEKVFVKLGITTRSAVAAALLDAAGRTS